MPKAAVAAGRKLARPSHLDRSTWDALVGTLIETNSPGVPRVPLLLAHVGDATPTYGQSERFRERSFVLVFHGPEGQPLAAATHILAVPGVGDVGIWFSNARQIGGHWEYVAVFANARVKQRPTKPNVKLSGSQRAEVKKRRRKAEKGAKGARERERLRLKQEREDREFARSERKRLAKLAD